MRLTTQLRDEMHSLGYRIGAIYDQAFSKFSIDNFNLVSHVYRDELHGYKVRLEQIFAETDKKEEQTLTLFALIDAEKILSFARSDDYERYTTMGIRIDPTNPLLLLRHGEGMAQKQSKIPWSERDYSFIDFYRKAYENETLFRTSGALGQMSRALHLLRESEAMRDFHKGSIRQINHVIQFGPPNLDLTEARCEIYKISVSFEYKRTIKEVASLKGSNVGLLFQNADLSINLGVWFDDPDIEMDDIYWYNILAEKIETSLSKNEGMISMDEKLHTKSCYVELHSHPVGLNGQNHILAVTPMEFLPIKEFEKRQKSIDQGSQLALMSSMMKIKTDVIWKKKRAKELKEMGNVAFQKKKFEVAEKFYTDAIELNMGSRPLWTNRAKCRNTMKKYEEAISDCDSGLSLKPKCSKTIEQKGNAFLGLGRFDEARTCFESLRSLGEKALAENCLKKLHDIQFPKPISPPCKKQKASKKKSKKKQN